MKIIKLLRLKGKSLYRRFFPEYDLSDIGSIGVGCQIAPYSTLVLKNMFLSDYVMIQDHVNFISRNGKLFVGKYSVISAGCTIIPGEHHLKVGMPFYINAKYHIEDEEHDIVIKEDCWIGASSVLLPGISIGRGAIIGAGSIVTKNVLPYTVVAGNPARLIAMRMKKEDVLKHEEIYPENERLSINEINEIFEQQSPIKVISDDIYTPENKELLIKYLEVLNINKYEH